MRIHTIAWEMHRTAGKDDVIPLAFPIKTKDGKVTDAIPVSKGQNIAISMCGYNRYVTSTLSRCSSNLGYDRLPGVWGEDAHIWNPERFLREDKSRQTSVGLYANLYVLGYTPS